MSSAPKPSRTTLTVMLEGGYRAALNVAADDPIIATLYEVLGDFEGKRQRRLIQIPIDGGKSMLAFPCDRLVAVHTDPPLIAEADDALPAPQAKSANGRVVAEGVEPSRVFVIDDFLAPQVHQQLMPYALANEARFVDTTTSTSAKGYRESVVLHDFPEFAEIIRKTVRLVQPRVQRELGCAALGDVIEAQMTSHNDGNYYKVHNDNGHPDIAKRELTYVYYFHGQPKAFSGGELKLYDSRVENKFYVAAESSQTIEPRDNRIVFFLSRYMHEVLPVRCPSRQFKDGRFTINGWLHRF